MTKGVYQVRNVNIPWRRYIGSSLDIELRWEGLLKDLNCGTSNTNLQREWDELGPNAFVFEIVEECPDMTRYEIYEREEFYIAAARRAGVAYNVYDRSAKTLKTKNVRVKRRKMVKFAPSLRENYRFVTF